MSIQQNQKPETLIATVVHRAAAGSEWLTDQVALFPSEIAEYPLYAATGEMVAFVRCAMTADQYRAKFGREFVQPLLWPWSW